MTKSKQHPSEDKAEQSHAGPQIRTYFPLPGNSPFSAQGTKPLPLTRSFSILRQHSQTAKQTPLVDLNPEPKTIKPPKMRR